MKDLVACLCWTAESTWPCFWLLSANWRLVQKECPRRSQHILGLVTVARQHSSVCNSCQATQLQVGNNSYKCQMWTVVVNFAYFLLAEKCQAPSCEYLLATMFWFNTLIRICLVTQFISPILTHMHNLCILWGCESQRKLATWLFFSIHVCFHGNTMTARFQFWWLACPFHDEWILDSVHFVQSSADTWLCTYVPVFQNIFIKPHNSVKWILC